MFKCITKIKEHFSGVLVPNNGPFVFFGRQLKKVQGALNRQGSEQQSGDDAREDQCDNEDHLLQDKEKKDKTQKCHSEEKNKEDKEGYFCKQNGNKMTIVFHAVLSPHFKFEKNQGDRIFMRFGGFAFGNFSDDVVEVHPER